MSENTTSICIGLGVTSKKDQLVIGLLKDTVLRGLSTKVFFERNHKSYARNAVIKFTDMVNNVVSVDFDGRLPALKTGEAYKLELRLQINPTFTKKAIPVSCLVTTELQVNHSISTKCEAAVVFELNDNLEVVKLSNCQSTAVLPWDPVTGTFIHPFETNDNNPVNVPPVSSESIVEKQEDQRVSMLEERVKALESKIKSIDTNIQGHLQWHNQPKTFGTPPDTAHHLSSQTPFEFPQPLTWGGLNRGFGGRHSDCDNPFRGDGVGLNRNVSSIYDIPFKYAGCSPRAAGICHILEKMYGSLVVAKQYPPIPSSVMDYVSHNVENIMIELGLPTNILPVTDLMGGIRAAILVLLDKKEFSLNSMVDIFVKKLNEFNPLIGRSFKTECADYLV